MFLVSVIVMHKIFTKKDNDIFVYLYIKGRVTIFEKSVYYYKNNISNIDYDNWLILYIWFIMFVFF